MIAYGPPLIGFVLGELVDNGNDTVSIQKPNGKYVCVTPEGVVQERDAPGGPWESYTKAEGVLLAQRDGGRVYLLQTVNL